MKKRASMELSVNSIVILVIAVVMMGLILAFIRTKFSDMSGKLLDEEPEPATATISDPITLSRPEFSVNANAEFAMKLNYFNDGPLQSNMKPLFICVPQNTLTINANKIFAKDVASNTEAKYTGILKTNSVAKSKYVCKVCMVSGTATACASGEPEKEFIVNII